MKLKIIGLALLITLPFLSMAQSVEDEINYIQSEFGMEKRALVEQYMGPSMNPEFWTVFDQFETERKELMKNRILIINEYLEKLDNLSEADADVLATKSIKNNADLAKLYGKYYKKVKKTSSAVEAAKFIQLENYIQSSILLAISESIPFIGERQ